MEIGDLFAQKFVVNSEVYNGFLNVFKDKHPLHTDDQYAMGKGFSGKVMHGNILNGFLSYFVGECLPEKNVLIHEQAIYFNYPVYLNDVLTFEAKITDIYSNVAAIEFKFSFKNQELKTVAKGKIQIGIL